VHAWRRGLCSGELREQLDGRGTEPVIPDRSDRKQPFTFNKRLYKLRWRIETAFNRLKDLRRIATRYDRLARSYLTSVCLAALLYGGLMRMTPGHLDYSAKPTRRTSQPPPDLALNLIAIGQSSRRSLNEYIRFN
jgi:hypothetical protein